MKYSFPEIGEFDDLTEVGQKLVETTSNFRDSYKVQTTFDQGYHGINITSVNGTNNNPGRLVSIPLESSAGGQNRGLDVYFVFDVSRSVTLGNSHLEAIRFAKAFVAKVIKIYYTH